MIKLKGRYCVLTSCIWIIVWSTIVYRLDGNYPTDYMIWFSIVGIVGIFIPWVFANDEFYESTEQHKARIIAQQNIIEQQRKQNQQEEKK